MSALLLLTIFFFFLNSKISNINRNVNMNIFGRDKRHRMRNRNKQHKQSTTENIMTDIEQKTLEEIGKEEASTNCASGNKKNQRYSSSFFANTTKRALTVEKEFHDVVGNNSKVKKSSSVHEGEDITLCWIETTTIKEDKTIRPPKRLVIREYTISFENSATIPERYLECKRYEGELTANDPDIGKTALFEIIDEDTMVSRIVNFTSVSHVGNIITWEHKKVKCGVGPVVSKNIIELNDGSKNPKKRVEIKVSPKMHQLTATTTEEEPCTESTEKIEESSTFTEAITKYTTGLSCEDTESGACEATIISPSILSKKDNKSSTEETIKLYSKSESESEEDRLFTVTKSLTLPDEVVSRRSTIFPKIPTTIQEYQEKLDCEENSSDPACLTQKYGTFSSEELFSELLTTTEISMVEAVVTEAASIAETSSISDKKITKEEIYPFIEERLEESTQSLFTSREEKEISDLTEETTPFALATEISMESLEAPQSTDQASVDKQLDIKKSHSPLEEVEEGSGESSIELISEELKEVSSSSAKVPSGKVDIEPDVTTMIPQVGFTEFTKELAKPSQILDKLSESSISTESVTEAIIIESSSTSEEVLSEESKESITSTIKEKKKELKTSKEGEFISTITTSLMKAKSTTLSPVTSGEVEYSCENSEECAYIASSEGCESGNCGETTTKCDSEICSEEEVRSVEDQSKFDMTPPSTLTEISSSEELAMIEHTTVTNIATTMLISQESENNSMAVNIPITTDTRRRSTKKKTTSTPRHKLTLKVKVLLEHINENKEKHNLVEVEKQLSLNENPEHHTNPDLLEQLKSLNDSVNMETLSALLNCTSLGNLTRDPNFVSKESDDALDSNDAELEFTNSELAEDSVSEQYTSESIDAKNDYSEYQEHEVSRRRKRKRRSLDDEMENLNRFARQNLYDPSDSVTNSFNTSQSQYTELITDNLQLSTITNQPVEETTETESERNVTKKEDQSTIPSTTVNISDDIYLSNTSEFHDANLTKENIQLTTTTYKPEEETSSVVYIESENNITSERNESAVPSTITENISNETKMEVVRETLPGIQEDVVVGLQHMMSQLAQSNLTSINNIKETVKTNLLGILADPKDIRIHSRRRRAATEEVGHWSNERIKEAPMGGNLRSFIEFTLYKVFP